MGATRAHAAAGWRAMGIAPCGRARGGPPRSPPRIFARLRDRRRFGSSVLPRALPAVCARAVRQRRDRRCGRRFRSRRARLHPCAPPRTRPLGGRDAARAIRRRVALPLVRRVAQPATGRRERSARCRVHPARARRRRAYGAARPLAAEPRRRGGALQAEARCTASRGALSAADARHRRGSRPPADARATQRPSAHHGSRRTRSSLGSVVSSEYTVGWLLPEDAAEAAALEARTHVAEHRAGVDLITAQLVTTESGARNLSLGLYHLAADSSRPVLVGFVLAFVMRSRREMAEFFNAPIPEQLDPDGRTIYIADWTIEHAHRRAFK